MKPANIIEEVKKELGSYSAIARGCQVTPTAVNAWKKRGRFPRTDYSGETHYTTLVFNALNGRIPMERLLPTQNTTVVLNSKGV